MNTVFAGFKAAQFFIAVVLTIVYFFLMKYLGFFSATVIYMVAALVYLRVPPVHTVIAVIGVNVMIYVAFVEFLGVRLPKGLLI